MSRLTILFGGVGFLATHFIPSVLPHVGHVILVDRERVEKANYNNSLFLKNYEGRQKVMAAASFIQDLASIQTTPIHKNIKKSSHLADIIKEYSVDFAYFTFDNIEARLRARDAVLETQIPSLFVGVTGNYVYIDWGTNVVLPETPEKIAKVEAEIKKIRDVCTRLEFRKLGTIAAAFSYQAFLEWLEKHRKISYQINVDDAIHSVCIRR